MTYDDLEKHRIKEIRRATVRSRYTRRIGKNARIRDHGDGTDSPVRIIVTDQKAIGWGLSWSPDDKMPNLIGCKISDLFDPEVGITVEEAIPIDFALHDLAGVILNMPVYKMLGEKASPIVSIYDGAIYMDDLSPDESPKGVNAVIQSCRDDFNMGYRDFKVKIGRGFQWMELPKGIQRDIDVVRAIHYNFPDCRILVDANDGYTCDDIIRFVDAVAECNVFWIEEPFRENRENLIKLKDFLDKRSPKTLIADGEGGWNIDLLIELGKDGLIDVLQMDIAGFGFTNWRKIMPELISARVFASPHTWGDPLKVIYTAHLSAGLGNIPIIEGIPSITYDADLMLYKLEDGKLHIPENSPGFGMRIKESLLED